MHRRQILNRSSVVVAVAVAVAALWLAAGQAQAGLTAYWPLDETSGTTAPNLVPMSTYPDGTLQPSTGGAFPMWVADGMRAQVIEFSGADRQRIDAGVIPALANSDDFSISFWTNQTPGNGGNDVILVSRAETSGGAGWFKFTPTQIEISNDPGNTFANINYVDVPNSVWVHHALVKNGGTFNYYRGGVFGGSSTGAGGLNSVFFQMGGDNGFNESWAGRIDDVALFDMALTLQQVQDLANEVITPAAFLPIPEPTTFVLGLIGVVALSRRRRSA